MGLFKQSIKELASIKRTEMLYENLPFSSISASLVALLVCILQADIIAATTVWTWFVFLVSTYVGRMLLYVSFRNNRDKSFETIQRYKNRFYLGTIASGLVWGSAGVLLFPDQSAKHQFFLAFAIGGIAAGSVSSLGASFKNTATFLLLLLSPITAGLALGGTQLHLVEGILILLFTAVMIQIANKMAYSIETMIYAQEKNSEEARIRAREAKIFQLIIENIPSRIFWKDTNLRYLGANRHFLNETKLPPGTDIVGLSDYEMPWAKRYEEFLEKERNIINNGVEYHYEERSTTIDGIERWLEVSKVPILNENNQAEGVLGIFQDITAKKQAEQMMRLAATAFETHEAVTITDTTGRIMSVNGAFTEITGYTLDEVIGKTPNVLSSGKHDVNFFTNMWTRLIHDGRWKGEIINKRKNGQEFTEQLTITAVKDSEGNVTNYVGVFSDVSEKIEIERQLRQSQKLDAVGTLVSGIAHEFNNMLVGISGNIFLSKVKVEDNPEVYEMLDAADNICFKAADMVKQLLTFARKDDATQHLKIINMGEWLTEGLRLAQSSVPANTRLICNSSENKLLVSADTTQLQQILINLLNNARDAASDRERPEIEVTLTSGKADEAFRKANKFTASQYVKLSVKDNGTGIPADKIEKIFEPFFTTKEIGKGTGLGMPVIQGIVQSHHGCIQVESTEGVGTTMHIILPRVLDKHQENMTSDAASDVKRGNGETILIADDEAPVLLVTKRLLNTLGYKTVEAKSGTEAVEKFTASPDAFDMVFLDVIMPELTGPAAALQIREIRPDIPIAFYSGYSEEDNLTDLDKLGNYKLLSKPYRIAEVSQLLYEMINRSE